MIVSRNSIGREAAIKLANSGWWKTKTHREIVSFQLFTQELSCPFTVFHEAIEKVLGRPVFTHEFGSMGYDRLVAEFLGEKPAPTMDEIINLIPEDKRILLVVGSE